MSLIERAMGKVHGAPSDHGRAVAEQPANVVQSAPPEVTAEAKTVPEIQTPPTTVEISLQRLARQGFIAPGTAANRTLSEFRMIKRPLLFNVSTRRSSPLANARRIMVTSALPGEGKTYCAINLALSIADERDHSVLLVDADVARPSVPETLGLSPRPGLMDALDDPAVDVSSLVLPTSIDRLSLLMAGTPHDKATEMLASSAMSELMKQLTSRFPDRIIVFDSPPLLATTEASVLASHMGQIVLVVESGRTDRGAVTAALSALENAPGEISTLMNKAPARTRKEFLPYHGYGYGY